MPGPVSDTAPTLADRMRAYSESHPEAKVELDRLALDLDEAEECTDIKRMIGLWARAQRRWSEITGEPLV